MFGVAEAKEAQDEANKAARATAEAEKDDPEMEPTTAPETVKDRAEGAFSVEAAEADQARIDVAREADSADRVAAGLGEGDTDMGDDNGEFGDAELPQVIGTKAPTETMPGGPTTFAETPVSMQPADPVVKVEKAQDVNPVAKEEVAEGAEEEKDDSEMAPSITREREDAESEQPKKKQAIDPTINETIQQTQTPSTRISRKDHPYTEEQASQILKGESGAELAFDD